MQLWLTVWGGVGQKWMHGRAWEKRETSEGVFKWIMKGKMGDPRRAPGECPMSITGEKTQ